MRAAGLEPWPRPFHNLRASRETELVETYPVQVVTSWLGNTPSVAMRHYLMTTDEHFATAIGDGGAEAAQKAAQSVSGMPRKALQTTLAAHEKTPVLQGFTEGDDDTPLLGVAGTGFEPATSRL